MQTRTEFAKEPWIKYLEGEGVGRKKFRRKNMQSSTTVSLRSKNVRHKLDVFLFPSTVFIVHYVSSIMPRIATAADRQNYLSESLSELQLL